MKINKRFYLLAGLLLSAFTLNACASKQPENSLVSNKEVYTDIDSNFTKLLEKDSALFLKKYHEKYDQADISSLGLDFFFDFYGESKSGTKSIQLNDQIILDATKPIAKHIISGEVELFDQSLSIDSEMYTTTQDNVPVIYSKTDLIGPDETSSTGYWETEKGIESLSFDHLYGFVKPYQILDNEIESIYKNMQNGGYLVVLKKLNENHPLFTDILTGGKLIDSSEIGYESIHPYVSFDRNYTMTGMYIDFKEAAQNYMNAESTDNYEMTNADIIVEYKISNTPVDIQLPPELIKRTNEKNTKAHISHKNYTVLDVSLMGTDFVLPCKLSTFETINFTPVNAEPIERDGFRVFTIDSKTENFISMYVENISEDERPPEECLVTGITYAANDGFADNFSVFDLKMGMSQKETEDILGPTEKNYSYNGYEVKEYYHKNCHLSLSFSDDNLIEISVYTF